MRIERTGVRFPTFVAVVLALLLAAFAPACAQKVTCDRFRLVTNLMGTDLFVSVDTDLPDYTNVMVSVSRSYFEKGDNNAYPLDYFQQKGTVGEWRQRRMIGVSHDTWKASFRQRRLDTAQVGIAGELARIDDQIEVSMVVPIGQTNPIFGEGNSNLTGKATTMHGSAHFAEAVAQIRYPLVGMSVESEPRYGNPDGLIVGETYRLARTTPLMPEMNPSDPLAAIAKMREIPSDGTITVREAANNRGTRWYRVNARAANGQACGTGWINSAALLGQELRVVSGRGR